MAEKSPPSENGGTLPTIERLLLLMFIAEAQREVSLLEIRVWIRGQLKLATAFPFHERLVVPSVFILKNDGYLATRTRGYYHITDRGMRLLTQVKNTMVAALQPGDKALVIVSTPPLPAAAPKKPSPAKVKKPREKIPIGLDQIQEIWEPTNRPKIADKIFAKIPTFYAPGYKGILADDVQSTALSEYSDLTLITATQHDTLDKAVSGTVDLIERHRPHPHSNIK